MSGVNPNVGTVAGGTVVSITNGLFPLLATTAVRFGNAPGTLSTGVTLVSSTLLQAVAPPGSTVGTVSVYVAPNGVDFVTGPSFSYLCTLFALL